MRMETIGQFTLSKRLFYWDVFNKDMKTCANVRNQYVEINSQ